MAHISNEYKLGDLVMYNHNPYKVTAVRRITTNIPYTIWDYEYDLKLIREPREGELSVIRGVNERAISRKSDDERKKQSVYYYNYRYDPKFMENMMYPVKSSLTALGELNRREFERVAAESIKFNIDEFKLPTKEEIKKMINNTFGVPKFEYKKIIFNGPCTIILWKDGTKTIAKASSGDAFDPEKGVAICFMKKVLGHTETNKVLRKASKDFYDKIAREANRQLDEELRKSTFPLPKGVTFRPFNFDVPITTHLLDNNNKVIKVKEEEQDDNLAVGSRCSTCVYYDKPMTKDPCCYCLRSGDQYEKREEEEDDN